MYDLGRYWEEERDFNAIRMVLLRNHTVGLTNSVSHNTEDNTRVGKARQNRQQ